MWLRKSLSAFKQIFQICIRQIKANAYKRLTVVKLYKNNNKNKTACTKNNITDVLPIAIVHSVTKAWGVYNR